VGSWLGQSECGYGLSKPTLKLQNNIEPSNMQHKAKSQKQDPNHKVPILDRIVAAFAIIASIAQVIGVVVQIAEYINNQSEPHSIEVTHSNSPKITQAKQSRR